MHGHGCLGLNDSLLCCLCPLRVCTDIALVKTTGGVVAVIFSAYSLVLAGAGEGVDDYASSLGILKTPRGGCFKQFSKASTGRQSAFQTTTLH